MRLGGGKKHLVIGGTGQLGLSLVRYLVSVGRGVRTIVRSPDKIYEAKVQEDVEILQCELDDIWMLHRIIEGSSVVYYCATRWITETYDAIEEMHWAERIANACLEHDIRLIVPTCAWAYGKPSIVPVPETHPLLANSPYGIAKATVEHVVVKQARIAGLPATILRVPPMWGPYARCPVSLYPLRAVSRGRPFLLFGSGDALVEWIDPRDVARAMYACSEDDRTIGGIYNIPGSGELKWSEFARWVTQVAGTGAGVRYAPPGFIGRLLGHSGFAQSLSWWYNNPLILDGSALVREIKFTHTYQLKQSILDAWHWYANRRPDEVYGVR